MEATYHTPTLQMQPCAYSKSPQSASTVFILPSPKVSVSATGLLKWMLVPLANVGRLLPLPLSINKSTGSSWLRPAGCSAPKSSNLHECQPRTVSGCSGLASQAHLPAVFILLHSEGEPVLETQGYRGWPSERSRAIQMWASACINGHGSSKCPSLLSVSHVL